ncbi:MAG: phosphotransferase [Acidimicrobiales bacterium]|nr:phosphotransferase [Acidimicrobiales bacterium]MYD82378.1 phosphotransferase [Acidimicrobiales bacterium]MYJ66101.1 phosphotransferase [Acidimicrobiales bacterium]
MDRRWLGAAHQALDAFGVDAARLELVGVSENITFQAVESGSRQAYVLRLHRPGYHTDAELDSERVWLAALRDAGISVPTPVSTPDGRYFVPVEIGSSEIRNAGINLWADGEIVGVLLTQPDGTNEALAEISEPFGQLGGLMAAMHNQAAAWTPPPSFRRHRFDVDGLLGDAPFWGPFWEHPKLTADERSLLVASRNACRAALAQYGEPERTFSMIHADLHLANLLVSDAQLAVIDFDDAGFGWHQYDIAVAMYHSRAAPDFDEAAAAFLHGYRSVRPISDDDLGLVPMFELIRGMAIIGWKAQRPEVEWPDGQFELLLSGVLAGCRRFLEGCRVGDH